MRTEQALEVEPPPTMLPSLSHDEEIETRSSQVFALLACDRVLTEAALAEAKDLFDRLMHYDKSDRVTSTLLADLLSLLEVVDDRAGTCPGYINFATVVDFSDRFRSLLSGLREPVSFLLKSMTKHSWFRVEREELRLRQLGQLRFVLDEFKRSIEQEWSYQSQPYEEVKRFTGFSYDPGAEAEDTEPIGYIASFPDPEQESPLGPNDPTRFHEILQYLRAQVAGGSVDDGKLMYALLAAVDAAETSLSRIAKPFIQQSQGQHPYYIASLPVLQAAYLKCLTVPPDLDVAVTRDAIILPGHAASSILDSLHEAAKPSMAPDGLPMTTLLYNSYASPFSPAFTPSASTRSTRLLSSDNDRVEKVLRTNIRDLLVRLSFECRRFPSSLVLDGVAQLDAHAAAGGAYADVYRGTKDDMMVALKRLRTFTAEQRDRIQLRFYREVILWQYLDHPHTLRFLGLDDQLFPPHLCMVAPWMENGNLLQYTVTCNLSIPEVNRLLYQTADGLEYLHEQRLIHGDLRCANILVNEKGEACLADFGLATLILESGIATGTSSVGSPRWSAPELFTAESPAHTEATDIYSLACVCLELHTRKMPFEDVAGEHRVIYLLMTGKQLVRPSKDRFPAADTSDGLWSVMETCWSLDAAVRPTLRIIKIALISRTD